MIHFQHPPRVRCVKCRIEFQVGRERAMSTVVFQGETHITLEFMCWPCHELATSQGEKKRQEIEGYHNETPVNFADQALGKGVMEVKQWNVKTTSLPPVVAFRLEICADGEFESVSAQNRYLTALRRSMTFDNLKGK